MTTQQPQETGFTAEIDQYHLHEYLAAPDALADECIINVENDQLRTAVVDPANVAMCEVTLGFDALLDASGDSDRFGIDLWDIEPLVTKPDTGTVTLDYDADRRKLGIEAGSYSYTHACHDPESVRTEPDLPTLDLNFRGQIDAEQLRTAVQWFDEFTTHVTIGYEPGSDVFYMQADERTAGGDIGTDDGRFELARTELEYVRDAGRANSHFSLDYLKDIVGAIPEDRVVTFEVGEEFPMKFYYDIGYEATGPHSGVSHGQVTFMQAPRIQS